MLYNTEIEDICQHYNIPLVACCMKDALKDMSPVDGNYILNLASSNDPVNYKGTHFLALIIRKNEAIYFDSFGVICPTEIIDFVKRRHGCKLGYTTKDIQYIKSEMCGFYAVSFLKFISSSKLNIYKKTKEYLSSFDTDQKKNDAILKDFYMAYFKYPYPSAFKKILK